VNRRETLALHRLSLMRLRMRATNQRRLAALADVGHQQQRDDCPCPACAFRRTLTQAMSGGIPGVTVLDVGGVEEPKADDTTPKH